MEAMDFDKKPETWQDQYKRRKRFKQTILVPVKADIMKLNMTKIGEEPKEDKSSSISEKSFKNHRIPRFQQEEINPQIDQEEYYQDIIVNQFESLTKGDQSIFSIYKPPDQSTIAE